jgi:hypothetical protein
MENIENIFEKLTIKSDSTKSGQDPDIIKSQLLNTDDKKYDEHMFKFTCFDSDFKVFISTETFNCRFVSF